MTGEKAERLRLAALTAHQQYLRNYKQIFDWHKAGEEGRWADVPPLPILKRHVELTEQSKQVFDEALERFAQALRELGIDPEQIGKEALQ